MQCTKRQLLHGKAIRWFNDVQYVGDTTHPAILSYTKLIYCTKAIATRISRVVYLCKYQHLTIFMVIGKVITATMNPWCVYAQSV